MKLTIEVTAQAKGFDKYRSRVVLEIPTNDYVTIGDTIQSTVSSLISQVKHDEFVAACQSDAEKQEQEQLEIPFD